MRIVIDMQGVQTGSRFRGIGRYVMSYVQALVRQKGDHEIILALSSFNPDTIEPIRQAFVGLLPPQNIRVWYAPSEVERLNPDSNKHAPVAARLFEAFLADLQPDVIHISSLFEGFADQAVTGVGQLGQQVVVTTTLYDLIPLLNPKQYLDPNPIYAEYYHEKLQELKQVDYCLAISEFARQEGLEQLQLRPETIVTVSTAIEPEFQPLSLSEAEIDALRQKFGIRYQFVMYTGGTDDRKNLPRLVQAYAQLTPTLRAQYQLVLVGRVDQSTQALLCEVAKKYGLLQHELCFAGYVSNTELVQLYNLCALFVFPSWHEGFGLPALEAMACGAPVIGAGNSSLPEVIGLDQALFDPFQVDSIAVKIAQVLEDPEFAHCLREHGLKQASLFSWDEVAKRTFAVWEQAGSPAPSQSVTKRKLALVSPLPPERSGIADYSAELIPALAAYYDIELVVVQDQVDQTTLGVASYPIRDEAWLREHAYEIDRVVYQVGNSPFHAHMLGLVRDVPGVVVLHDFYLSGLRAWLEVAAGQSSSWVEALYASHGYNAVQARFEDEERAKRLYPANFDVISQARGVIVHSQYSRHLAQEWYGDKVGADWEVIPLLRQPAEPLSQTEARRAVGLQDEDFVICTFGFLDQSKHNLRLLEAWLASDLAKDPRCQLVFVGSLPHNAYGDALQQTIKQSGVQAQVHITGFVPSAVFRQYLSAADLAVQLRTQSRGETSAAVLDCMNYGLPLIMNANGSMAEIDSEAVWMLPDVFTDAQLVQALEHLWQDPQKRRDLGQRAQALIHENHAPHACAQRYMQVIEHFYHRPFASISTAAMAVVEAMTFMPSEAEQLFLAQCLAQTLPAPVSAPRLFLDVTATQSHDLKTGIERVARAMVLALLQQDQNDYRIEPVYLQQTEQRWHYRYAREYTLDLLGCSAQALSDDVVDFVAGDRLITMDLSGNRFICAEEAGLFTRLRRQGVGLYAMVYDLLPMQLPQVFPIGAEQTHRLWAQVVAQFDGAVAISKTVADDFMLWRQSQDISDAIAPFRMGWVHLGADVENSAPSTGLPADAAETLAVLHARPSFLMVGTIEPRKGYLQTIQAFTQLWQQGHDVNLVIVGQEGWRGLDQSQRRDIPAIITLLKEHPELNKRLVWLKGISDEYLEKVYAASTCLIAASIGEGFGLPLIEAAQHQVPILARDIPVFKEVAQGYAFYFTGDQPNDLAQAVIAWLGQFQAGTHPHSTTLPWLTWQQSAQRLGQFLTQQ